MAEVGDGAWEPAPARKRRLRSMSSPGLGSSSLRLGGACEREPGQVIQMVCSAPRTASQGGCRAADERSLGRSRGIRAGKHLPARVSTFQPVSCMTVYVACAMQNTGK